MNESAVREAGRSRVTFEDLDMWVRQKVQSLIQSILEEEISGFLGRMHYQRRDTLDGPAGYRNGYGRPRKLTLGCGTIELRRPRLRGLEERFESQILPFFIRRSRTVDAALPELYLHGLPAATGFDVAIGGCLGNQAPISASTIARLKEV